MVEWQFEALTAMNPTMLTASKVKKTELFLRERCMLDDEDPNEEVYREDKIQTSSDTKE